MCIKEEDLWTVPKPATLTMVCEHQHKECKAMKRAKRALQDEARDPTLRRAFFLWMEDQMFPPKEEEETQEAKLVKDCKRFLKERASGSKKARKSSYIS
jgi:hypothetical protein